LFILWNFDFAISIKKTLIQFELAGLKTKLFKLANEKDYSNQSNTKPVTQHSKMFLSTDILGCHHKPA
jgi:hypothetical protein